ncbi:MAG: preprotein translocase subunit SecG [Thermoanaerobaculales bacterium]
MTVILVLFYVFVCLFLVMVVLLQQGKGADLAGAFGGGGSQTSFGPRTNTNIMHRMTTGAFVLFVVLCLALAILSGKQGASVMESVVPAAPVETSQPETPAIVSPGEEAAPAENLGVETEGAGAEEDATGSGEGE